MICTRCKKNIAVVFITKMEGDKQVEEGLCLSCAKKLGIGPIDKMMNQMGIDEEQLEMLNEEMSQLYADNPELAEEMENGNPLAFIGNLLSRDGGFSPSQADEDGDSSSTKTAGSDKKTKKQEKKRKLLETYGTNLTRKAQDDLLDRVIGRDAEIERVIQILNRRSKNNPVLLGEPGVGKTAIAEGLATRIAEKNVPAKLLKYEIYLIDFTALVAGTQFRGQFEARLKGLLEEARTTGNIILVIDEIHNIVAAGDADGAMSAANILKPALAKGDIQVIGATTLNEYRKHIEKDSALERRFQPVIIDEPSVEDSVLILKGIKDYYEKFHNVIIPDKTIVAAVNLAEKYITDRFLPDKAIDLIDEAGSLANLKNQALIKLENLNESLKKVREEKEEAANADSIEDYQKAADFKIKECRLLEEIEETKKQCTPKELTVYDVASVVEKWTKIPVNRITEIESEKLIKLEERITSRIVGQDTAVSAVSRAIRRNRAGIVRKKRPVSFIFVGPTGVGKTELVKVLSREIFDTEDAIIRLDMSEYMEKHSVAKMIGSPPGYIGYDDAGQLTEKIRRKPYSVILLDEIEKAHSDVFNILLQILDDGRITDSHGKVVSFENAIIIMTSNAGSTNASASYGFGSTTNQINEAKVNNALKEIFRPEFLNRVDEIITFNELTRPQLLEIVTLLTNELAQDLKEKNISLTVTDKAKEQILEEGYSPKFGARPLRRVIQKQIEDLLAEAVIRSEIEEGDNVIIDFSRGKFLYKKNI